jgi:hypothetical protein
MPESGKSATAWPTQSCMTEPVAAVAECVAGAMAVAEGSACSYVEYWPVAAWRPMWRPMED